MAPPVFGHGRLRLYLLRLLDREPMHGYELIQAIEEDFGGTYTPSAGTIYPRLAKLQEEGLVTKVEEGRKTVYAITDAGRTELHDRQHELDDLEREVTDTVRRLADEVRSSVDEAMKSLRAELAAASREAKAQAKAAGRATKDASHTWHAESRSALQSAEIALNDFRLNLRTDLRGMAARGELTDAHVSTLNEELGRVYSLFRSVS